MIFKKGGMTVAVENDKTQWQVRQNRTYNQKYNDRRFDIANSNHIDQDRSKQNVYWD